MATKIEDLPILDLAYVVGHDSGNLAGKELPNAHTHPVSAISDSTATGQALVTAANAAAVRTTAGAAASGANSDITSLSGLTTPLSIAQGGTGAANAAAATAQWNAMVGDSGAGGTKGLVPAPAAGDAAAGKFLKADGTWSVPAGGSGTLNNYSATAAPTVNDDTGDGYAVGSLWLWAARGLLWQCANATAGAAEWALLGVNQFNRYAPKSSTYFCDFYESLVNTTASGSNWPIGGVWSAVTAGTGATVNQQPVDASSALGVRRLDAGTTTSGVAAIEQWSDNAMTLGSNANWTFATRFRVPNLPDGTETYSLYWGFRFGNAGNDPSSMADTAEFHLRWTGSAAEFVFLTRNNSGTVQSTVITTPSVNTWYEAAVQIPQSGNVLAFIDGTQVATHSTKPRTTVGVKTHCRMKKTAGTTSRTVDLDYMFLNISGMR